MRAAGGESGGGFLPGKEKIGVLAAEPESLKGEHVGKNPN